MDAWMPRQQGDIARPRVPLSFGDRRLAAMIDDHLQIGIALHHLQQRRQLRRLDECIEAQVQFRHHRQRRPYLGAQDPLGIGKIMQHRTQRLHQWIVCKPRHRGDGVLTREIDPPDDAAHKAFARMRCCEQKFSFCNGRRCLHEDRGPDPGLSSNGRKSTSVKSR
jgi:hypothetical protein